MAAFNLGCNELCARIHDLDMPPHSIINRFKFEPLNDDGSFGVVLFRICKDIYSRKELQMEKNIKKQKRNLDKSLL